MKLFQPRTAAAVRGGSAAASGSASVASRPAMSPLGASSTVAPAVASDPAASALASPTSAAVSSSSSAALAPPMASPLSSPPSSPSSSSLVSSADSDLPSSAGASPRAVGENALPASAARGPKSQTAAASSFGLLSQRVARPVGAGIAPASTAASTAVAPSAPGTNAQNDAMLSSWKAEFVGSPEALAAASAAARGKEEAARGTAAAAPTKAEPVATVRGPAIRALASTRPPRFRVRIVLPVSRAPEIVLSTQVTSYCRDLLAQFRRKTLPMFRARSPDHVLYTEAHTFLRPDALLMHDLYVEECLIKELPPLLFVFFRGSHEEAAFLATKPDHSVLSGRGVVRTAKKTAGSVRQVRPEWSSRQADEVGQLQELLGGLLQDPQELPDAPAAADGADVDGADAVHFDVQLLLPGGQSAIISCDGLITLAQLKEQLFGDSAAEPSRGRSRSDSRRHVRIDRKLLPRFAFRTAAARTGFLTNELVAVHSLAYVQDSLALFLTPKFLLVEKSKTLSKKEKLLNVEIGALIGKPLSWTNQEDESTQFRKSMGSVRRDIRRAMIDHATAAGGSAASVVSAFAPRVSSEAMPDAGSSPFMVVLQLPLKNVHKTVIAEDNGRERADSFIGRMFKAHYARNVSRAVDMTPADFILKVDGFADYLHGPYPLLQFEYVRRCVTEGSRPRLALIEKPPEMRDIELTEQGGSLVARGLAVNAAEDDEDSQDWHAVSYRYPDVSDESMPWDQVAHVSVHDLSFRFRVQIIGVQALNVLWDTALRLGLPLGSKRPVDQEVGVRIFVRAGLYFGGNELCEPRGTSLARCSSTPRWQETLEFPISMANLPRRARICFALFARVGSSRDGLVQSSAGLQLYPSASSQHLSLQMNAAAAASASQTSVDGASLDSDDPSADSIDVATLENGKKVVPLGWVAMQLFDYKHELRTSQITLNLWPGAVNPIGTSVQNLASSTSSLCFALPTYQLPVVFTDVDSLSDACIAAVSPSSPSDSSSLAAMQSAASAAATGSAPNGEMQADVFNVRRLLSMHSLVDYTSAQRALIWDSRMSFLSSAEALPKVLACAPWHQLCAVREVSQLLDRWERPTPTAALELLDARYADERVRAFAVQCIEALSKDDFASFLLQLVQALKYEPYHDSLLARFVLMRALGDRVLGHHLYWYLRSEVHVAEISERYGLLLEAYLRGCGAHMQELKVQDTMVKEFVYIANKIKDMKDDGRLAVLRAHLLRMQLGARFSIPITPSLELRSIVVDKCKYMDSKKLPLWVVFENADPLASTKTVATIFKAGDDLRQDMLTLQMLGVMDKLWKREGLDLRLSVYGCIATGNEMGFIEVVPNSETTANISKAAGGATAAFREDPLKNWLEKHNPTRQQFTAAVENFIYSCAGYCVATYVLGIGDRHNDNIMCSRDGRLFHIDFGHFLGNVKKKFGYKRERAPFVFTPDFAYVMGGRESPDFSRFVKLSQQAYLVLRRHANLFLNLFGMMLSTGIPELQTRRDILYIVTALQLESTEEQAAEFFRSLINESLASKATQLNNMVHILAH